MLQWSEQSSANKYFANGVAGGAGGPTVGGALPEPRGDGGFADSKTDKYGREPNTHTHTHTYRFTLNTATCQFC